MNIALALGDIAGAAREAPLALSVAAGMAVRHGTENGSVTLGGRRISVDRPRAQSVDGHEVPANSHVHFAAEDMLTEVVMERMLAGVATRRRARISQPIGEATGTQKSTLKSAVSRRFVPSWPRSTSLASRVSCFPGSSSCSV